MGEALERTIESGQSLLMARLELIASEAKLFVHSGATSLMVGAVALTGWLYLMQGVTDGFAEHYPRFAVESAIGVLHLGVALLCILQARSR
jgi:hypothetical protein